MKIVRSIVTSIAILFGLSNTAASETVDIAEGVSIYYEEAGTGQPLVFIPGWTMTTKFFENQIAHFSKNYRTITFDPRSHGQSTKVASGNNYGQHGRDLKAFIEALDLENVILVGWSFGAMGAYSYVDQFGTENLEAIVFVDQGPSSLPTETNQWAIGPASGLQEFAEGLRNDRQGLVSGFLQWTVERELNDAELQRLTEESMQTPDEAAIELIYDGWLRDYGETLKAIDIPVLNVVRTPWEEPARTYLTEALPDHQLVAFGSHAMFWEYPEKFNKAVSEFLDGK